MTNVRRTRKSLTVSTLALLLCFAMLLGTTFAWFTDSTTSANNIIQSGNLDIEMYWAEGKEDPATTTWQDASRGAIFNNENWEPGYTEVRHIKIANVGTLSLQYMVTIVANGEVSNLADVIDVYYIDPAVQVASREALADAPKLGTLTEVLAALGETGSGYLASGENDTITIALKMQESAGNEYQDTSLCDGGFSIQLIATQATGESDSFDNNYDGNAVADLFPGFQGGSVSAAVNSNNQGLTTAEVTMAGGDTSAIIPAGVMLADGVSSLELTVALKNTSESNIHLSENEQMRPLDVHIEGVAPGNTTPMIITLKHYLATGLNAGALRLYHVENGVTVPMTHTANPTNHNEFSYDPITGDLTLALASFSEVAVVADSNNPWDGKTETAYSGAGTEDNPYLIANADQLAYFRTQVDNGNSFEGKFVKLNNNIYLSNQLFDPIGWGYVNNGWNSGDVDGKVFQGTFDGGNHTIFDLYQSGWDLESATGTDYTYTNCGFGLFAAASNATFKNLTISGAYVRAECVEMGVLVGLSQNSCTYKNIEIHNSKIANYQRPAGGLIGEVSGEGTTTITNVIIGSDVVVGSLWGDFDAPCGGVIGARWDDIDANPQIVMKDVEVGARMDVYSDVTSAYQWYAYRRAGMLIGNTELSDPNNQHLAAAPFLTCENVKVYYGDWAAYHYCQFTNQDNSWCNNYPWVRVEAGENCSAYSNPRYGQPVVDGVTVSTDSHTCTSDHKLELRFNQLYGGGQGVYGQAVHDGVEVINYRYSITYVNDYQVLAIKYVTEAGAVSTANSAAQDLVEKWASANITGSWEFGGWMNAGSTKIETISADNTKNIVLYPYFNKPYTARFVDQQGNVVAWCLFHAEDLTKLNPTREAAEAALPNLGEDLKFDYWEVHITDNEGEVTSKVTYNESDFAGYQKDVTIYPVYKFEGDVKLIPVDTDSDGIIDYYHVAGYSNPNGQALVNIPHSVNGIPITEITGGAFSSYDGVHSILIPKDIVYIGDNAFAEKWSTNDSGETITIYYAGSYADWVAKEPNFGSSWESGISSSTRIFFLNGGDTVDVSQGYLQAEVKSNWGTRTVTWNHNASITSDIINEYIGHCDCEISTTGDNAHIYVDANENVMKHNDAGTPVNANGKEIYFQDGGWFGSDKLTDGTNTYYRYRPDIAYWEGVTAN